MTMFCGLLIWTLVMAQAVDGLQCYSCFLCSEGDTSVTITCPPEKNACYIEETTNPIGKYVKECEANNGTGCEGLKCTCKTDLCNSALSAMGASAKTDSNIGMTTASGRKSPATYQTSVPPVQNSLDNTFHSAANTAKPSEANTAKPSEANTAKPLPTLPPKTDSGSIPANTIKVLGANTQLTSISESKETATGKVPQDQATTTVTVIKQDNFSTDMKHSTILLISLAIISCDVGHLF